MRGLFLFEYMKSWRGKKVTVVLIAFLVALVGMVLFNMVQDKTYWSNQRQSLGIELTRIQIERTDIEAQLSATRENMPEDTEAIDELSTIARYYQWQYLYNIQQQNAARDAIRGLDNSRERLELWIVRDLHLLGMLEAGHDFLDETPALARQRLAANQYLLEENIEPLNSPYQMTAINFAYQLTNYPWILIILLAICLLTMGMFSGDIEGGAYKVLYSQPFSRGKIYAAKYLVNFFNSFVVVTGLVVVVFGIVALINGLGDANYPAMYFSESYQSLTTVSTDVDSTDLFTFVPWTMYFVQILPMYFMLCWFVISLIGAASLLLNNTANVLSALFCMLVLDFLSRSVFTDDSVFLIIWPLTAANLNNLLHGLYTLSALGYLLLLGAFTALSLAVSLIVLIKRDMTGGIAS